MANIGGPRQCKHRLLMSTVDSILLYGSEIWAEALNKQIYRKQLTQIQRRAAIRITSAYRTVSEPAIQVIAGVTPIDLLARERQAVFRRKSDGPLREIRAQERARTLAKWEESWAQETRGRWTAKLIPRLKEWIGRKHGETNYFLTQFLSGHGYFNAYLHRMGKAPSPECAYCGGDTIDDVEHTFMYCTKWDIERNQLAQQIRAEISSDTIVKEMLASEMTWNAISGHVEKILRKKKADMDRTLPRTPVNT